MGSRQGCEVTPTAVVSFNGKSAAATLLALCSLILQVNRDTITTQTQRMKNQIEQQHTKLFYAKGHSSTSFEELQILKQKIALVETSNADIQKHLQEHHVNIEQLSKQAIDA